MTIRMKMVVAAACLGLLAGCGSSGSGGGGGLVLDPEEVLTPVAGPLGLLFETPVNVMSADADANTVRVADDLATVTLNDLTFDEDGDLDTFSITLGLPDGSSVTFTEDNEDNSLWIEDSHKNIGETGVGVRLGAYNDNGDSVNFIIGFNHDLFDEELSDAEIAAEALYILARVDRDGDTPDFGFDTYLVGGAETDTMPAVGSAEYSGFTIASIYHHGDPDGATHVRGGVWLEADFEDGLVDIQLWGDCGSSCGYDLYGNDLAIDGSGYDGAIAGDINPSGFLNTSNNAVGDLIGAFFGTEAEATAGVFGATGTDNSNHDVEIVGAFGASVNDDD